ncbi:MAG: superoxide dismutase, Cu-Zn family [Actinomycetota bacterium]|jgi:Cu-Zn family superoxide dismutase|nr:superoxide dismutase, Cu-Zn family [Actinomycetota bacterium]
MGIRKLAVSAAVGGVVSLVALVTMGEAGHADPAVASATLVDINGNKVGDALFTMNGDGTVKGRVRITVDRNVTDPTGTGTEFHGFHIHANNDDDTGDGNTNDGCVTYSAANTPAQSAWFSQVDGHWDTASHSHGNHTGDLPSLARQSNGEATIEFALDKFAAPSIVGKALVVHFQADDFGKHPTVGTSATTGNAGFRYACGEIVASARNS